jgi:phosphoribosylamine-glycine ligase
MVLVMTAMGSTVTKATEKVYDRLTAVSWSDKMYRNDIGKKLETSLPALHRHGYALDMAFE